MSEELKRCVAKVFRGPTWHGSYKPCGNPAVAICDGEPVCKVHDPVAKEARKAKRGPTQFEREIERIKATEDRESALQSRVDALVDLIYAECESRPCIMDQLTEPELQAARTRAEGRKQ